VQVLAMVAHGVATQHVGAADALQPWVWVIDPDSLGGQLRTRDPGAGAGPHEGVQVFDVCVHPPVGVGADHAP
jgi:hypothetical protein